MVEYFQRLHMEPFSIANYIFQHFAKKDGKQLYFNTLDETAAIPAVGRSMDMFQGVKMMIVFTQHLTKSEPKIAKQCFYPLTG